LDKGHAYCKKSDLAGRKQLWNIYRGTGHMSVLASVRTASIIGVTACMFSQDICASYSVAL